MLLFSLFFLNEVIFQLKLGIYNSEEHLVSWLQIYSFSGVGTVSQQGIEDFVLERVEIYVILHIYVYIYGFLAVQWDMVILYSVV